jgi:hypothetical protein
VSSAAEEEEKAFEDTLTDEQLREVVPWLPDILAILLTDLMMLWTDALLLSLIRAYQSLMVASM